MIFKEMWILPFLLLIVICSCIRNPGPVEYDSDTRDRLEFPDARYIGSIAEDSAGNRFALSSNYLFNLNKNSEQPAFTIIQSAPQISSSFLIRDRAGRVVCKTTYGLIRLVQKDTIYKFETIYYHNTNYLAGQYCVDDTGNIFMIDRNQNDQVELICWDGENLRIDTLDITVKGGSYFFISLAAGSGIVYLVINENINGPALIHQFRDAQLTISDTLAINTDSCRILNAFVSGEHLNLLLDIRGYRKIKCGGNEKFNCSWDSTLIGNQYAIVKMENGSIILRDAFDKTYNRMNILKATPDELWLYNEYFLCKITPFSVSSKKTEMFNGIFLDRSDTPLLFYAPTLQIIELRDLPGF